MTQTEDLNLHFVLPSEDATEDECSADMKAAFDCVLKYGNNGKWVQPSFCLQHKPSTKDVFIFDRFEGEAFEKLKQNSSKVLGSRCMLTCLSDARSIPSRPTPVFTEGMRDLVICATGFDSKRKCYIQEKVEYMGGIFDRTLRTATTHVVTMNNLSVKAIKASALHIPLMKFEWIDAVWNESLKLNVNGRDMCFEKYRSPLLHNLRITTSGIAKSEKEKIKNVIQKYGGTFTGEMEEGQTDIVIISKPQGEKYKYATSWKIPCVKPVWLYNCDREGIILDYNEYLLKSEPRSSTPNKDESNISANFSTISRIDPVPDRLFTRVNETSTPNMTTTSDRSEFQKPKSVKKNLFKQLSKGDILTDVTLQEVKEAGQFLDGCNIYLFGFSLEQLEKLKKILNLGGATRFDDFSASVTHVIVGNAHINDLNNFKSAVVLSADWLIESVRLRKQAPENLFLCVERVVNAPEPPSPLSKQAAQLFSRSENKTVVNKLSFDQEELPTNVAQPEEDLIQKYNGSHVGAEAFKELDRLTDKTQQVPSQRSSNASFTTENTSTNMFYFKDLKFFISEDLSPTERNNMEEVIIDGGGEVVGKRYVGVPDYAVVPLHGAVLSDITTREVVNMLFIVDCCLAKCIVPLEYYHQPVAFVKGCKPLTGCVITVSNYLQRERDFMEQLIVSLGAVSQPSLARRPKENILKSTHLVCAEASGPKYSGALRWGLPIVHHDWLLKCASLGIKVSEEPYLVGDSKCSKNTTTSQSTFIEPVKPSTSAFNVKNTFTTPESKKVIEQSTQSTFASKSTPVLKPVNNVVARLRQQTPKTAESPDANRTMTPTSPYGAFYGNDNPSPGTRKRLLRWMNQGADFPLDPPPKKIEEEKTTPVGEVLRRQLLMMKRKPEDAPPDDSPVAKRPNFDVEENGDVSEQNDAILNALQKMKEIEENYKKNQSRSITPVRNSNEYVNTGQPQMLIIAESQPHTEVGWEDPTEKEIALDKLEKSAGSQIALKIFMLSGFTENFNSVQQLIEDAGGKVSSLNYFDKNATHLIATSLTRAEKVMGSIAAGIWILHPSYLDELKSVKSVYAVNEEDHEWGNPLKTFRLESLSTNARECAQSSYFWRNQKIKHEPPPFQNMKIILHIGESKYDSFKRILEVGGAVIVKEDPPYDENVDATLCIYDASCKLGINISALASQGVKCVSAIFISDKILRKNNPIENNLVSALPGCKTET